MAGKTKAYQEEARKFVLAGDIIVTHNSYDIMSARQMQFLYNRFTEKRGKKFMTEGGVVDVLDEVGKEFGFNYAPFVGFECVANADGAWFEKGKAEIRRWLDENAGQKIQIPFDLQMCHVHMNGLIGVYNAWEKEHAADGKPCLFKFIPDDGRGQYWGFEKACDQLGYALIDDAVRVKPVGEGLTPRLGIYDASGKNLAPNSLNYYAEEAEEDTIAPAAERKSNGQA
ncbi:MAG: hypothetical protein IIY80_03030 [Aeriscardovia sp.]|nr:hypothetical protein [Aeriscardovia sp.]